MSTQSELKKEKRINGVNIYELHDTIKAVRTEPVLGSSKFRVSNRWIGRGHNRSTVGKFFTAGQEHEHQRPFVFDNDEPPVLLGEDQGGNPVEFVLHALAGCVTTTTVYHAAARGINIQELETTLEGDLDLQGFLGISDEVPKGYQNIRVKMKIKSDAEGSKLEELKKLFAFSPVYDTLTRAVKVDVQIDHQE